MEINPYYFGYCIPRYLKSNTLHYNLQINNMFAIPVNNQWQHTSSIINYYSLEAQVENI